jgi:hypothetical protein
MGIPLALISLIFWTESSVKPVGYVLQAFSQFQQIIRLVVHGNYNR